MSRFTRIFPSIVVVSLFGFFSMVALVQCGKESPKTVTITGSLVAGTAIGRNTPFIDSLPRSTTLAGYKLYCVSFANPPASGSGTADSSGSVSVSIEAFNVAIGCFVQDADGNQVATMLFKNAAGTRGPMASFSSETAAFGTITVDTSSGNALVTLSDTGTVVSATPAGTACPVGKWTWTSTSLACAGHGPGTLSGIMYVTKDSSGGYHVSESVDGIGEGAACGIVTYQGISPSYNGETLTYNLKPEPVDCPAKTFVSTVTFDTNCSTAVGGVTATGCGDCSGSGVTAADKCNGCGSNTCTGSSVTTTKQ